MGLKTIIVEKREGTAILTLNRPDKLNAVNMTMRREILATLAELEADVETKESWLNPSTNFRNLF